MKSGTADAETQPTAARLPLSKRGSLSISALLLLLIAAAMLPPLLLSALLLDRNNRAQTDVVATLAEAAAGAAVQTVESQLQGRITALRSLSTARALRDNDLQGFYEGAQTALAGTNSFVIVLDVNMNQLLNTRVPFGEPLGRTSDPAPARQALESGVPVISNGFFGKVAQKWVFNIILPWTPKGSDPKLLVLAQDAETLSSALSMENLRGGWNAAIIDNNNTVLASTLMSSDVGKPFFLGDMRGDGNPVRRSVDLDGKHFDMVVKTSALSGWNVILWTDRAAVQRPLERTLRLLIVGGIAIIAIGSVAAWLFGRQIAKSVRRLADEARRLGAGEQLVATSYPVRELAVVSAAMADAAAQRRASENEIRFLMREVAHRSKNQLTVVSSIAKQSARNATSVAAFNESFQQRLMGLARSTDLLITGSVAGVELKQLIAVQVEPFKRGDGGGLAVSGPLFHLSLQAAQTLGLAFHEMATNAAKYGAFSTPLGRLSVTWRVEAGHLVLIWREHVPALKQSERTGFGTQLIERMVGGALDAKMERVFHPDGLECRFEFPLEKVEAQADAQQDES